jgi:hypothetical protein
MIGRMPDDPPPGTSDPAGSSRPPRPSRPSGAVPPSDYAPTALPSTVARVLAFAAILVAGFCGGVIGYAFVDLQCTGDCSLQRGVGALIGAVGGAVGVAIVATLTLRAMGEWRTIQHQEAPPNGHSPT